MEELIQILKKSEQVTRMYSRLYKKREELYSSLCKRRKFFFFIPINKKRIIAELKGVNGHERQILGILLSHKNEIMPSVLKARIDDDISKHLLSLTYYFDSLIKAQEKFLAVELEVLDRKRSWNDVAAEFEHYFNLLNEFELNVRECDKHLFSPKELIIALRKNQKHLPTEILKILVNTSVFVPIFELINVSFDSMKMGQFFDPSKWPPLILLIQWIIVAAAISYFNLPIRIVNSVKSSFADINQSFHKLGQTDIMT